jgi:hypothetical protein
MAAMNGSRRFRVRIIGLVMMLTLGLAAVFASSSGATVLHPTQYYLGMGDSLAFGYSQQAYNENEAAGDPATALQFNHGYVNDYYSHLGPALNKVGLVNDGCPGETSASLIGNGPLAVTLEGVIPGTKGEAPCAYSSVWNAFHKNGLGGPLHHEYAPAHSQLEDALTQIATDFALGKPVTHITFNIGANDELHTVKKCEAQAKTEVEEKIGKGELAFEEPLDKETGEKLAFFCIQKEAPGLFEQIATNQSAALFAIRNAELFDGVPGSNYGGPIIMQGGYDPYGAVFTANVELLPGSNVLAAKLNGVEATNVAPTFGACFANPQPYFNPSGAKEPMRLKALTNMGNFTTFEGKANGPDIHPTKAGYARLKTIMVEACG